MHPIVIYKFNKNGFFIPDLVLLDIQNEIATLEFSINQKKKQMPSLYCLVLCRFIYAFVTRNPGMIIGILEIIPKKRGPKTRKVFADWSFVIYKHLSNSLIFSWKNRVIWLLLWIELCVPSNPKYLVNLQTSLQGKKAQIPNLLQIQG